MLNPWIMPHDRGHSLHTVGYSLLSHLGVVQRDMGIQADAAEAGPLQLGHAQGDPIKAVFAQPVHDGAAARSVQGQGLLWTRPPAHPSPAGTKPPPDQQAARRGSP